MAGKLWPAPKIWVDPVPSRKHSHEGFNHMRPLRVSIQESVLTANRAQIRFGCHHSCSRQPPVFKTMTCTNKALNGGRSSMTVDFVMSI